MMDQEIAYRRAVDGWTARVEAVGPDQWALPTPCEDWDVRALVNHVVGEDRWTDPLMRGSTIEEVGDRLDGDLLGDDPRRAAADAAAEAIRAVADRLPTQGTVRLSYGEERMEEYVAQLTADHLVHAWDLAAATGSDTSLDDDLVAAVAEWFAEREELYRSAGMIAPRVEVAGDGQAELLARFGRSSRWGRQH
ncbi:TIGR03086 family metal-binding protein [Nocardioides euryhalodurans]|uniref:TIGR03086 family protein n=1 Tax=Nocardioides euryhalodurans TaxID=2518370 RepID=A0A4P7GM30_9ACTN|nr:TIGR03086 family metal-binding protein [Nocardioides euryhalodurans]QBR93208.1 TIGR03086 family protein [Nocardioides euryhalodurans]